MLIFWPHPKRGPAMTATGGERVLKAAVSLVERLLLQKPDPRGTTNETGRAFK
jgi:hypothetical protein